MCSLKFSTAEQVTLKLEDEHVTLKLEDAPHLQPPFKRVSASLSATYIPRALADLRSASLAATIEASELEASELD